MRATAPSFFATWAQIFQYDMKRLGIDVEIKYFGTGGAMFAGPVPAASPSTS